MSEVINLRKERMDKKVENEAPELINLRKEAVINLRKARLDEHVAKVALILDISQSMYKLYKQGKVQNLAERVLAASTVFDDDGAIDVFLFGEHAYYAGECTLENYKTFLNDAIEKHPLESYTNYHKVMNLVRRHYFSELLDFQSTPIKENPVTDENNKKSKGLFGLFRKNRNQPEVKTQRNSGAIFNAEHAIVRATEPVFAMFVTDGEASYKDKAEEEVRNSSYEPIFWSLMGLGQDEFKFLERLDYLPDRFVNNASAMVVQDPVAMTDEELYSGMVAQYKDYPDRAKRLGLLE